MGQVGENKVIKELQKLDERFTVKNNVKISGCQIDHLVIFKDDNIKRAFVIETKLWGGNITGTENSTNWQQHLNGANKEMYSPIRQNFKHCTAVKFKYGFIPTYSVVCMCGKGSFPNIEGVVHLSDLIDYLYSFV